MKSHHQPANPPIHLGYLGPKVVAGMNPMDLKRGIDAAVKLVLEAFILDHILIHFR